ncbi:hypothetical protein HUT16_08705 [Kitasatospora sp. NA04385]|uniref:hypothetical protein n=1 Tax=Kitasatospora sp. NA04385 TaxID=2742135 RepID=UPI0015929D95|nr:hypothetical protein [Kitasatospora sp. NA04385]QKW19131.1 hypothetical protein HUT16_08705 [Kitasatospora sp. NA04385]
MRVRTALAAGAAAALLLTGCASHPVGGGDGKAAPATTVPAGPEPRPASGAAAERAAEVAAAWPGSDLRQAWEHGYYPVEDTTEWLPSDAFHSGADKAAYDGHRFDLEAALPVSVSGLTEVRFADGSALTLPQRSARAAFDAIPGGAPGCAGACPALTVTAVRPGTREVATSRGPATVPVWEFTVAGYAEPFRYPAVLPQAGRSLPRPGPTEAGPWSADGTPASLSAVSPDGLLLTGYVPSGCAAVDPGSVYETDLVVVLIGHTTPRRTAPGEACPASRGAAPVEFRLARPLGTRVVLGLADGLPQLPQPARP